MDRLIRPRCHGLWPHSSNSLLDIPCPFLTLDDATAYTAARQDHQGFLRRLDGAVIDGVQRLPELLLAIKLAVDERRRPGRFLLTGNADVMALPRLADSLAGRLSLPRCSGSR